MTAPDRAACICGAGLGERHVPLCEAFGANVLNLDIGQEDRPDPRWLRQLAETLKLEADLLKGHSHAMPTNQPTRAAVAILASIHMGQASDCLAQLADLIDAAPSDHAVAFLPRVNSSLADTAPLPPLSHAGGGPGSLPGREAASGSPAAGRPLLESDGA
jgi:hypothetical protein